MAFDILRNENGVMIGARLDGRLRLRRINANNVLLDLGSDGSILISSATAMTLAVNDPPALAFSWVLGNDNIWRASTTIVRNAQNVTVNGAVKKDETLGWIYIIVVGSSTRRTQCLNADDGCRRAEIEMANPSWLG